MTYSHQGQIRIQLKKEIKSFYQVKGAPQRASIARNRSQKSTQGKYSELGKKTDVKKIGLHERLQSFPNEHLCLRGGKLFCNVSLFLKQETERLKEELATRDLGLIFDGSNRLGEAIVIIVRFVSDKCSIVQRLIRLDICAKSVNAQDLAHVLKDCLSVDYQVRDNSLLATMKDGASVYEAAVNLIKFVFPKMPGVVCFSHTLDNVAENHFKVPDLPFFGSLWIRLFKHSHRAKLICQEVTGRTTKSYSETRWRSKWEMFGDVCNFFKRPKQQTSRHKSCRRSGNAI